MTLLNSSVINIAYVQVVQQHRSMFLKVRMTIADKAVMIIRIIIAAMQIKVVGITMLVLKTYLDIVLKSVTLTILNIIILKTNSILVVMTVTFTVLMTTLEISTIKTMV